MEWLQLARRSVIGRSRHFLMLIAGAFIGVIFGTLVATPALAADGTWDGQQIIYKGSSYSRITDTGETARKLGLPEGSLIYATYSPSDGVTKLQTIYFLPDADISSAKTAKAAVFAIEQEGAKKVSETDISMDPAGAVNDVWTTHCGVEHFGWVICPMTNGLAGAMDGVYSFLMMFLDARQLNITDRDSGIFKAWNIMLGFANVAFIAGFLMIIYSQVTSVGISNYGIKRLLPRLIVAAILVNLSFYICAIAIDLSNISGQAVQDMFASIRNTVANTGGVNPNGTPTWGVVAQAILTGGGAAGGAVVATGYVLRSALPWLLPALLAAGLALLVVIIVLAARQALIVILTIISPLAFVCYILPGTEKWFEKWRDLFFTMLIFFPAFSAVFGGAQLAGLAIVQNADSIVMTILGLTVQVAPLAIAPLIMKLSGGLLNRFAGIFNNPQRGLIDKSKQWAEKKSEQLRNKRIYGEDGKKNLNKGVGARFGKFNPRGSLRRIARSQRRRSSLLDSELEVGRAAAENDYRGWEKHRELDLRRRSVDLDKQQIEKELERSWNDHVIKSTKMLEAQLKLRVTTDKAAERSAVLENIYEELKAGGRPLAGRMTRAISDLQTEAVTTSQHLAAEGLRKANAQRAINQQNAKELLKNKSLQDIAAGTAYEQGRNAALASAITTMRSDYSKAVEEGGAIVKHFNLSAEQRQKHALGKVVVATDDYGNTHTFDVKSVFTREYAIDFQVRNGTVDEVKAILEQSGSALSDFKTTISEALVSAAAKGKAPWFGGKTIDDVSQGIIKSEEDLIRSTQEWLAGGKFKPEDVANIDPQGFALLRKAFGATVPLQPKPGESTIDFAARQLEHETKLAKYKSRMRTMAGEVLKDRLLSGRIIDGARPSLEALRDGKF